MSEESLSWKATKWFTRLGGRILYHSARLGSKATWKTTKFAWNHKKEIANGSIAAVTAGAGVIKGTGEFMYDTGSIFYYKKEELAELENKINAQSELYTRLVKKNSHIADAGIIAGVTLADYLTHSTEVPGEINQAFEMAYPNLAQSSSFTQAAEGLSESQLPGFLAGVKGKLFEIKYASFLNDGHLPEGYSAELASSPIQAGWDIKILGPDGEISDVLQCKATDSVSYITAAIRKYPDIDVVTTDEVHSQVLMHAADENIVNSGISDASLEATLENAADLDYGVSDMIDLKLPLASLAMIAFTEYIDSDKDKYQKYLSFGERSSKAFVSYTTGGIIAGLTNTWWLGLLATIGTRFIAGTGKRRRLEFKRLKKLTEINDKVILNYAIRVFRAARPAT